MQHYSKTKTKTVKEAAMWPGHAAVPLQQLCHACSKLALSCGCPRDSGCPEPSAPHPAPCEWLTRQGSHTLSPELREADGSCPVNSVMLGRCGSGWISALLLLRTRRKKPMAFTDTQIQGLPQCEHTARRDSSVPSMCLLQM